MVMGPKQEDIMNKPEPKVRNEQEGQCNKTSGQELLKGRKSMCMRNVDIQNDMNSGKKGIAEKGNGEEVEDDDEMVGVFYVKSQGLDIGFGGGNH